MLSLTNPLRRPECAARAAVAAGRQLRELARRPEPSRALRRSAFALVLRRDRSVSDGLRRDSSASTQVNLSVDFAPAARHRALPTSRYDRGAMQFARELRERIRRGRITCSVRIWTRPHVKAGGTYPMDNGHIVVDSIERIRLKDVTAELARESGFRSVAALLAIARHGSGKTVFLVRFHYVPPGGWLASTTSPARGLARRSRE